MSVTFVKELPPSVYAVTGTARAELKANPGQWALIATYPFERARAAYQQAANFNREGFKAHSRREGGVVNVYAMWPK